MEAGCGAGPRVPPPPRRRERAAGTGRTAATRTRFASDRSASHRHLDDKASDLKADVGGAIGRTAGVIDPDVLRAQAHEASFSKIYTLELHAEGIRNIQNLEKFTRLRSLDLSCNYIKSIEGLEHLRDLRELKLYGNKITTIQNLNRLHDLEILHLQHNRIVKIGTGLQGKHKLKELRLDSNQISELSPSELAQLSSLHTLDIGHNQLADITAVSVLPSLEELQACGNQMSEFPALNCCEQLNVLDLSDNKITQSLHCIHLPKHLRALNVSGNLLSSLESFEILRYLQDLDLSSNRIRSVRGISELFPLLETLNIANNVVSSWEDLKPLGNCVNLLELCVIGNRALPSNHEHSRYQEQLTKILPHLEILDGVSVTSKRGSTAITVRPMTANNAMISQKLVGQMELVEEQMEATFGSLQQRFSEIKCLVVNSLPQVSSSTSTSDPPNQKEVELSRPSSQCSSRKRIEDARKFAADHNGL